MSYKIATAAALALGFGLTSFLENALACNGEACRDLQQTVDGYCHVIKNIGNRTIVVHWGAYTFTLGPNQQDAPRALGTGPCIGTVVGDQTATYR
jgi:hypothetical protein